MVRLEVADDTRRIGKNHSCSCADVRLWVISGHQSCFQSPRGNARVSSKEQEKEGFSRGDTNPVARLAGIVSIGLLLVWGPRIVGLKRDPSAQLKLLKEYAAVQGFAVSQEYVDVETAKQTGRVAFDEMIGYLKEHPAIRVMLVEKTDRLYRNLKDWVTVDELDVEIHFPKEGVVLSRESRSSEKFMHGIKVLMAKNYIDNLSEEARKGMQEKAEQGIWPTKSPLGYRNVAGPDGKKIIAIDPEVAPIVSKLFSGTRPANMR